MLRGIAHYNPINSPNKFSTISFWAGEGVVACGLQVKELRRPVVAYVLLPALPGPVALVNTLAWIVDRLLVPAGRRTGLVIPPPGKPGVSSEAAAAILRERCGHCFGARGLALTVVPQITLVPVFDPK